MADLVETVVEAVKGAMDDDEEDEEEYGYPNGDDGSSEPPFQDLTAIGYRTLRPIGSTRIPGSHRGREARRRHGRSRPGTDAPAVSDPRGSVGTTPVTETAGSSEPFVEGGSKPQEPQTAGGSRPASRASDSTELSRGPLTRPAQRVPDSGPTCLEEEGFSLPEDEQGPTDLERAPNPQPDEGDPDSGFEPGLGTSRQFQE